MGIEKEAAVRVKLTGDDEVAAQANKISSAWGEVATKAGGAFKSFGGAVTSAVQGVLSDLGHVVSAAGAISFAGSVAGVEKLEESFSRLAVGTGRSFNSIQGEINTLARDINEMPDATQAWVASLQGLIYSYDRAKDSAKGLHGFALQTGQSAQQVAPLAVILDQIGVGGDKAQGALDRLSRQAQMLGRTPKEAADAFVHLQGVISSLSTKGDAVGQIGALVAGFGGRTGFTPQQRERALGGVLGKVEGNIEGFEREFGLKRGALSDEYGRMKDPTAIVAELQKYARRGRGAQFRVEQAFGREATQALLRTDIGEIEAVAGVKGGGDAEEALEKRKLDPSGRRRDREIRKSGIMQDLLGADSWLGRAKDWVGEQAADHPILTGAGIGVGAKMLAGLSLGKMFGIGKAAASTGTTAAEVGGGGLMAGLGLSGLAASGTLLGGVIATGKVLAELGAASKAKQGFSAADIRTGRTPEEVDAMSAGAAAAEAAAPGQRSPGLQAAMAAEQARRARAGGQAAAPMGMGASGIDPAMIAALNELVKSGKITQDAMAKAIAQPPVIEVINMSDAAIMAQIRGAQ